MKYEDMRTIMFIYECRDNILRTLNKKEAIILCTIFRCNLSPREKERYYRNSYIENGIETSSFSMKDGTVVPSQTVYTIKDLEDILKCWANCMTKLDGITMYTKDKDHRITIRVGCIGSTILSEDAIKKNSSLVLYQKTMNIFCIDHCIGQNNCADNVVPTIRSAVRTFNNYTGVEIVPIMNSLYSCRPYIAYTSTLPCIIHATRLRDF